MKLLDDSRTQVGDYEQESVEGTKKQMERLVEDLIQEGMANGAFDNLAGAGKPLPERPPDFNPYMDFTTHKMNQVLDITSSRGDIGCGGGGDVGDGNVGFARF